MLSLKSSCVTLNADDIFKRTTIHISIDRFPVWGPHQITNLLEEFLLFCHGYTDTDVLAARFYIWAQRHI